MIKHIVVALLIYISGLNAIAQDEPTTPLDTAYLLAELTESGRISYYELLLQSQIYLFAESQEDGAGEGMVGLKMRASILSDLTLVNVFDDEDRAIAFAKSRSFGDEKPILINGQAVFRLMLDDYFVLLNPETPFEKLFIPEEVKMLANVGGGVQMGRVRAEKIEKLATITLPEGPFKSALAKLVDTEDRVDAVYVALHPDDPDLNGEPNYFLIFETRQTPPTPAEFEAIHAQMDGHIEEIGYFDALFASPAEVKNLLEGNPTANFRKSDQ